ncbi:MAG: transposase [Candidatus Omnitrophota bacterium]
MPRFPRIHLEDAVYSIQMEGPSGEPIYKDAEDYQKYSSILSQAKQEFGFKLFSYALLPDRIHLLIEPEEEHPVSQIMQKITPNYTKYYNSKYDRKGHLFPKRFRSVYVERNAYLPKLTRFIHLLPEQSGVAASFREYPYSSYAAYMANAKASVPINVAEVMELLGTAVVEDPYERYMLSADEHEIEFLEKKLSRGSFLGSEEFTAKVRREIALHAAQKEQEAPAEEIFAEAPVFSAPAPEVSVSHGGWKMRPVILSGALFATVALSFFSVTLNHSTLQVAPASKAVKIETAPVTKMIARATPRTFKTPIEGMIWEVELYTVTKDGNAQPIKDKIRFNGKSFESYYFSSQGFSPSNYTVRVRENGAITWETMQRNPQGQVISWRGDLEGDQMAGVMSLQSNNKNAQDFSFMSKKAALGAVHNG